MQALTVGGRPIRRGRQVAWPHFGRTTTVNVAMHYASVTSISAGQYANRQVADGRISVTEPGSDHVDRDTGEEQGSGVDVAQIVEPRRR